MLNPWRQQASIEASRRRNREGTYTQPLGLDAAGDDSDLKALQSFLKEFYPTFYSRQAEAARQQQLEDHPEVALFHKSLVPKVVSTEEFWQRYEYRCQETRILQEWERHPARGRRLMGAAMSSWFDSKVESVKSYVSTDSAAVGGGVGGCANKEAEEPKPKNNSTHSSIETVKKEENTQNSPQKKVYAPPHKRTKETEEKKVYVPPHRRSGNSFTTWRSRVSGEKTTTRATTSTKNTESETKDILFEPAESENEEQTTTQSKKKLYWIVTLVVFAILVAPFLPRLLGVELWFCDSLSLTQGGLQPLLCPSQTESAMAVEPVRWNKKKKKKNHKPKSNMAANIPQKNSKDVAPESPSLFSGNGGIFSGNYYNAPVGDEDSGSNNGMVQNLVSSWMQNTDLSQFTMQSTDLAQAERGWKGNSNGNGHDNDNSLQPKKGGLVGFFQRRFGRGDRQSSSHAVGMPQMVVHQHIHHVVHHVVHEVRQS